MSEFAATLPRNIVRFCHLVVESLTAGPGSRGGESSGLSPTEKSVLRLLLLQTRLLPRF